MLDYTEKNSKWCYTNWPCECFKSRPQGLFCKLFVNTFDLYISKKNIEIHLNSGKTTCKSEIDSFFLAYLVVDSSLSSSRDITGRKQLWTSYDKTLKAVYVTNWKFKCQNTNQLKDSHIKKRSYHLIFWFAIDYSTNYFGCKFRQSVEFDSVAGFSKKWKLLLRQIFSNFTKENVKMRQGWTNHVRRAKCADLYLS
jgi:hypothetical protein